MKIYAVRFFWYEDNEMVLLKDLLERSEIEVEKALENFMWDTFAIFGFEYDEVIGEISKIYHNEKELNSFSDFKKEVETTYNVKLRSICDVESERDSSRKLVSEIAKKYGFEPIFPELTLGLFVFSVSDKDVEKSNVLERFSNTYTIEYEVKDEIGNTTKRVETIKSAKDLNENELEEIKRLFKAGEETYSLSEVKKELYLTYSAIIYEPIKIKKSSGNKG